MGIKNALQLLIIQSSKKMVLWQHEMKKYLPQLALIKTFCYIFVFGLCSLAEHLH